jgi:hypothetical protein
MPFRTFNSWLFDNQRNSPIPKSDKIDILKYNSPITHTFVVSMFLRNGYLNSYLNKYFNDMNLRYLSKEELFKFIKKCVMDFKIKKRDIVYYPRKERQILFEALRERISTFKDDDIMLLCEVIEKSENKDAIFETLGLERQKKKRMESKKIKDNKKIKIPLKDFLNEHFSTIEV